MKAQAKFIFNYNINGVEKEYELTLKVSQINFDSDGDFANYWIENNVILDGLKHILREENYMSDDLLNDMWDKLLLQNNCLSDSYSDDFVECDSEKHLFL